MQNGLVFCNDDELGEKKRKEGRRKRRRERRRGKVGDQLPLIWCWAKHQESRLGYTTVFRGSLANLREPYISRGCFVSITLKMRSCCAYANTVNYFPVLWGNGMCS